MLTKEQRDLAEQLRNLLTEAQRDDDPDIDELAVALSRCVRRFDQDA